MSLPPLARRALLTTHVVVTVGWLGAVVAFLGIASVGLASSDAGTVRGAYLVMEPVAWAVLVPLALASLVTGVVQSLGTKWGLLLHWWVVCKLLITVVSTMVLLAYMRTFAAMADVARDPAVTLGEIGNPSPVLHAALALVLLLVATVLAVFKPRGLTRRGRRAARA